MLEVDVDVGRLVPLLGNEALEQRVDPVRPDFGDADAETDDRIGGRTAPLAEDVLAARELDDVVDRQEIAGVVRRSIRASSSPMRLVTDAGTPAG